MTYRDTQIRRFLERAGWDQADRRTLAADASFRSYDRLTDPERGAAVLMNAPPDTNESVMIFADLARALTGHGLSAPRIFAEDEDKGLLLIEDLGDDLFARLCERQPELEGPMYAAAVDVLVDLARQTPPEGLAPYSDQVIRREASLLTQWYMPAATGSDVAQSDESAFLAILSDLHGQIAPHRPVLVMRDYHAENLLWLPDRIGVARVGLLDFQDALADHPAYDLVSLLEDARRDTSAELQAQMRKRYLDGAGANAVEFDFAYAMLGAQRNLKIVGIFVRLAMRDGKPGYLRLIQRVWHHLQRDLSHPDLRPLSTWIDRNVPVPSDRVLARIRDRHHAA